jgi:hypothetical protein
MLYSSAFLLLSLGPNAPRLPRVPAANLPIILCGTPYLAVGLPLLDQGYAGFPSLRLLGELE